MRKRLALFGSGRGSNGEAIYKAIEAGYIEGEIVLIISDRPNVGIVEKGCAWHIPVHIVEPANYGTEAAWTQAMLDLLQEYEVEGILLAGYMRILPPTFVQTYRGNILNIHPSLLPAFTGLQAQKQALLKGVKYTGCTVHFVDEGMDTGPIIVKAVVPVYEDDTVDTLSTRILHEEHRIYPEAVRLFCEDALNIVGSRVVIEKQAIIK
ncbi:MAG: phosphoribosylglycinamide formyltransferase [Veillonella sp. oral taxon 780]|uniref:phosphoribosylglycinamide formyltransferase n=1 Tax=Veillonella sp. CNR 79/14 TaxID=2490954 RepID=UPI000F8C7FEE|nr:phosphoribosylglycinamide formyltransferase [Veillonella sp. CNR 79/14]MBS6626743.1 phosphoribosylglycinamide formyltransferase [Veillonella sp. oral taxon 780]